MTDKLKSDSMLGGMLLILAANGGHWLITPADHPTATVFQYAWAWGEVIFCGIGGWRLLRGTRPPTETS